VNFSATRTWLTKFGKRTGFRYYNCTSVKRSDTGLDPVMRTKFENFVLGLVALKAKNHGSEKDAEYGNFVLSQIANLDESPFAFVNAKNLKTWARKGGKTVAVHVPGTATVLKRFCTVIGCIVADPEVKQPKLYLIFKGRGGIPPKEIDELNRAAGPNIVYGWQDSAWTDSMVLVDWYTKVWEPYVKDQTELGDKNDSKKFLLLLDNLRAHKDATFVDVHLKDKSNTVAWFLPENQTESAQPLDQGYFSVLKHYYSLSMENWLKTPANLDKWEGVNGSKFSTQERRVYILEWIRGAIDAMQQEQVKDPKKYCYSYFLKCGILATLTGKFDEEIKPQSFPNFRLPRERLDASTGEVNAPHTNDADEEDNDNDAQSEAESEYAEPEDETDRMAFRQERVFDFQYCLNSFPEMMSDEADKKKRKKAKWTRLTREDVLFSEIAASKKRKRVLSVDEQSRMTTWFEGRYIARLHNEEGWVHGIVTKMYPAPLKRGAGKGCNSTIAFQSGQHEGEGDRFVLLNMDLYDETGDITLDSGAWCVVEPFFHESAQLVGEGPEEVEYDLGNQSE